ncbi:MAG: hypothetical protein BWY15_00227 [Firmicutes bacterium ADurb.Bin193]|nr:MAG: hypothetical protein BWY15_00227 [Firmicutes bacterium ADurb.Bin193]
MLNLKHCIFDFFKKVKSNNIEIYNEFSLQHEMGIYLRSILPEFKIQFERNVSFFNINSVTIKKEIDIVVYKEDLSEKYAIELKCPNNGQYPEQLYSFTKDIKFMEQLHENGFDKTYCVSFVSSKPFYSGTINEGIYKYYRDEFKVYGNISKPTGAGKETDFIILDGIYDIRWIDFDEKSKFYVVEISDEVCDVERTGKTHYIPKDTATKFPVKAAISRSGNLTTYEIRNYIRGILVETKEKGKSEIVLISGHIHKELNLINCMPPVCDAMYSIKKKKDKIIYAPPKGKSSRLEIKYYL